MRKSLLALAPLLVVVGTQAAAAAPSWKVSEVSGDVRLVEAGKVRAAFKGALLSSGATIATGPGARAVIVRGEEFVVISPRSQLRVPAAAAAASGGIVQMIQDFGTSLFKIQKKSTPHFGVQTPYLAAVVKGTTFTVTVGPEGGSVQVTEGAVQVSTLDGGAAELVRPGGIASVGASDLYRLTLEGDVAKAVRSPKAPVVGTVPAAVKAAPHSAAARGPRGQEMKIARTIGEKGKSLSEVTKGLVEGRTHDLALAEFRDQARAARKAGQNPGKGDGGNKPDKGDGKDKPGKGEDKDKPGKDEDKDKPGKGEDKDKPGKDEDKDKPGKDEDKDKPGKDEDKDKPGKDEDKDKPGKDGGKDKPDEDDGKDKPDEDDGKDKPAEGDGKDKPAEDDGKDKPAEDDGKDKPAEDGGEDKPAEDDGKPDENPGETPDDKPDDEPEDGKGGDDGKGDDGDDGKGDGDDGKGDGGKGEDGDDDGKGDDGDDDGKGDDGDDDDDGDKDGDDDDDGDEGDKDGDDD